MATTLTASTPEDLLALVPITLGFHPTDSIVMLTFGAERAFHARVDLPGSDAIIPGVVASLLEPALQHGVQRVIFVLYAPREVDSLTNALVRAFSDVGIAVVDAIRTDGERYFSHRVATYGHHDGVEYDISTHPYTLQAAVDHGVHPGLDRSALAASLQTHPGHLTRESVDQHEVPCTYDIAFQIKRMCHADTPPMGVELAFFLSALRDKKLRDIAWSTITATNAKDRIEFWRYVLTHAPADDTMCAPAVLLAFCAWRAGNGALAWCAFDRCTEVDPDYTLAHLVGQLLQRAIPPSSWEDIPFDQVLAAI